MADYNLSALNTRDFEHLIQSLAIGIYGPGVSVFGDGPDGGREATFQGSVQGPTPDTTWDGYGVLQCKFRQRPKGDVEDDTQWALKELRKDLDKFTDDKRDLKKPDYYVFVTNVVLTPAQDSGGKDKVEGLLNEYKPKIGLTDSDVWDYDKICRLLDSNSDVRIAYGHLITAGDVLAVMQQQVTGQTPDFWNIATLFLQAELRADLFARLEQAGHTQDQKIALAHVFVDLPALPQSISDPPEENEDSLSLGIVQELLSAGSLVFRPSIRPLSPPQDGRPEKAPNRVRGRFVLVGGPGQGKSTLGQFLCQLYRASLLSDVDPNRLLPETGESLALFRSQCEANNLTLPTARRFPVRIVLSELAADLAKNEVGSLVEFILKQINALTGRSCSADDMRRWLREYPWLLVLDGLDEVPAASNRPQLIEAVIRFLEQAQMEDADLLVLATTRAQGYAQEFSPIYYEHRYLSPLSNARAMHYAHRLADARYSSDAIRRQTVLSRLQQACSQSTTARLMRSPLQVTIMATLVEMIGQPPQERWKLFKEYFEVVYRREVERDIATSRILNDRRDDVDAIHRRAGLLLQTESELAGGTEARLSKIRLEALVRAYYEEEGCPDNEIEGRIRDIMDAAINRLVFLVGLQEDSIGFEIRSLQEFMAAEALMDGSDAVVEQRLNAIAPAAHWRNVLLFAAGRCFSDRRHLRPSIVTLCEHLNEVMPQTAEKDALPSATLAGSRLALDLLADGVARDKFKTQLVRVALRLLEIPDDEINARLAEQYDEYLGTVFQEAIESRLALLDPDARTGAWVVLKALTIRGLSWASTMSNTCWPNDDSREALRVLMLGSGECPVSWAADKFPLAVLQAGPRELRSALKFWKPYSDLPLPSWCSAVCQVIHQGFVAKEHRLDVPLIIDDNGLEHLSLVLRSINGSEFCMNSLIGIPIGHPDWESYRVAARFASAPDASTLAEQLRDLANSKGVDKFGSTNYQIPFSVSPWPLTACIASSSNKDELEHLAALAENGNLGTADDWRAAEERWRQLRISSEDYGYTTQEHWPFDKNIGHRGFPFAGAGSRFSHEDEAFAWDELLRLWRNAADDKVQGVLASKLFFLLQCCTDSMKKNTKLAVDPDELKQILEQSKGKFFPLGVLPNLDIAHPLDARWQQFFIWLSSSEIDFFIEEGAWESSSSLAQLYIDSPEKVSLLWILGSLVVGGSRCIVPMDLLDSRAIEERSGGQPLGGQIAIGAHLMRLANAELRQSSEIEKLAVDAANLDAKEIERAREGESDVTEVINLSLSLLHRRALPDKAKELFLIALRQQARANRCGQEHKIIHEINQLMSLRQSSLHTPQDWEKLELPKLPNPVSLT